MANPYLVLWCDPTKNKLYSGWQQNTEALVPVLKQGDNVGVELHWVTRPVFGAIMDEVQFPPSCSVTLGLGRLDAVPKDGTFTITYNGDTTPDLGYDTTAAELDTALNNLASITAEGGVSVTKTGSDFRIVWNDRVNYTNTFTCNVDALSPTSESQFVYVKDGSAYANRIVLFKIKQSVIAGTTSFTASPPPEITVVNLFSNVWRITAYPTPKDGVFTLTFGGGISPAKVSSIISLADSSGDIQENLNALDIGTFEVVTAGPYVWDITVPPAATVITAQNGLVGFSSLYGVLNMNTAEVEEFLSGASEDTAILEVQVDMGGEIQTLIQTNVTVINDLIQNSSFDVVDLGQVMPVDSVVRYDTSQSLTSAEQLQARQNIDAVGQSEISAFNTDIATLEGQMIVVQGDITSIESNFDQALLTTSDVQFNSVTVGTNTVIIDGTSISVSDNTDTLLIEPTGITFPDSTTQTSAFSDTLYLSKNGNLSGLADVSVSRTNLGLGTMAVAAASDYLSKAGNLSGLASASTARTNLGLGTMSVETATNYLAKADNLSGLTNTLTARSNIGLGSSDDVSFNKVVVGTTINGVSVENSRINITHVGGYIMFPDGIGQYVAGPSKPNNTTYPFVPAWSVSGQQWIGEPSNGQLWLDQGASYQAKYGSYDGVYGSGAIAITEDTWTTSMELNARGLKFPDGTTQTTASSSAVAYKDICVPTSSWTQTISGSASVWNDVYSKYASGNPNNGSSHLARAVGGIKYANIKFYFTLSANVTNVSGNYAHFGLAPNGTGGDFPFAGIYVGIENDLLGTPTYGTWLLYNNGSATGAGNTYVLLPSMYSGLNTAVDFAIKIVGSELWLYANGTEVAHVTDFVAETDGNGYWSVAAYCGLSGTSNMYMSNLFHAIDITPV